MPRRNRFWPENFDVRLAALLIGVTLSTLDASALQLALPSIAAGFHTNAAAVQGAASLYLIGSALAFLPLSGLAGRIGTVRIYRISLLAFSVVSLLLALSPNLTTLLVLRFVQGIAGAGVIGLVPGLAAATFKERKGWALGMVSASVAAGTLTGPPIGGLMVDAFGWRSIFYINLPLGVVALLLSGNLGELPGVGLRESLRRVIAAPAFLLALLATVLFYAQSFGTNLLWPFYLEANGMTPSRVGFFMLLPPIMLLFLGPWAGKLSDRKGFDRVSWLGSVVLALSSLVQGVTGRVALGLAGIGFGRALFQAANNAAVLAQAPEETEAVASGFLSIARVSGQALGSIIAGSMWGTLEHQGAKHAFLVSNLVLGSLAVLAGVMIKGRRKISTVNGNREVE
ncbi:MFS transporter [Geobacter sp. SVR]|uniref:MFS transporter n=1 Tax=Geobacter sp. SVR TaxID=2495594 RepID=UPI00143F054C|nr:MFS transporter [Geobacter sp. SVR]BCS53365.1 MFS transporter [Geobacter sp. SVR]GCF85509.1 MFS transporter [Geobacter sp. SVR]